MSMMYAAQNGHGAELWSRQRLPESQQQFLEDNQDLATLGIHHRDERQGRQCTACPACTKDPGNLALEMTITARRWACWRGAGKGRGPFVPATYMAKRRPDLGRFWHEAIVAAAAAFLRELSSGVLVLWLELPASAHEDRGSIGAWDAELVADHLKGGAGQIKAVRIELERAGCFKDSRPFDPRLTFPACSDRMDARTWAALLRQVFERDDYTCAYCRKRGCRLECGHVIPVVLQRTHELSNLMRACFRYNRDKWAMTVEEWLENHGRGEVA